MRGSGTELAPVWKAIARQDPYACALDGVRPSDLCHLELSERVPREG